MDAGGTDAGAEGTGELCRPTAGLCGWEGQMARDACAHARGDAGRYASGPDGRGYNPISEL